VQAIFDGIVNRQDSGLDSPGGNDIYIYSVDIQPVELTAGQTFWINIVNHSPSSTSWGWYETADAGNAKQAQAPDFIWGSTESSMEQAFNLSGPDSVEQIFGDGFESRPRLVFASSGSYTGDLVTEAENMGLGPANGLEAGDMICQKMAEDAGLEGTYMAWLSDSGNSPSTRFNQSSAAYLLVTGTKVADDWDDLVDGSIDAAISKDATGANGANSNHWTGTLADGTPSAAFCQDWISSSDQDSAAWGRGAAGGTWTQQAFASCDSTLGIYCFEQ